MVAAAIAPQAPRQPTIVERNTRGGRKLFYRLEVIQQPERARACGSGPKSSADRRPVDPPPVVELRIFEGSTLEQAKDITFLYNANFFLYTTLEHARAIAHGRGQAPQSNTPPILTGMPVSGMAYLDRPQEAGYFLFPDLSVRHEGMYRLVFNLYEETKDPKDKDNEPTEGTSSPGSPNLPEPASFDFRMEVKSDTFNVYSAKKFPGLAESTTLSRTVAEQGCRVRIRRDVRMRRRDGKAGGDYEGEDEYARRRRTETPEYRARSSSNTSVDRTPYMPEPQRRPSVVDYPPPPPSFAGPESSATRHLTFGSQPNAQYQPQPPPSQQPPSVPPSPSYQGPQQSPYSHQSSYPPPPQTASYPYVERPPSQHYPAPNPSPQRETYPHEYRRPSSSSYGPPPVLSTPTAEREYRAPASQPQPLPPQAPHRTSLPSVADLTAAVETSNYNRLPPMPSPTTDRQPHRMSFTYPSQPAAPAPLPPLEPRSMKRSMDEAFPGYVASEQRYQDGRRQEISILEDGPDDMPKKFVYKRADGSVGKRDEHGRVYP
ncbi:Sexual development activator [Pleurostoma richardsiae]|uniref:Sexual development activator n=1 Tax=Pleurostoma richardsiae TaxID=41990 RepID=A0AA38RL15_9PEZI|nr:Sexual development activator [Pleurostoma richardsiae]